MTASRPEPARPASQTLAGRIAAALADDAEPALVGPGRRLPLRALAERRLIAAPEEALQGRCFLVRTRDPLAAATALASLDGRAARLVLCPPDLDGEQLAGAARVAGADGMASDDIASHALPGLPAWRLELDGAEPRDDGGPAWPTEWALFTSGTSGTPKMVGHTLDGLTGAIPTFPDGKPRPTWATFYDVRRYGGLQMLLRALVGGFSLHLTGDAEPIADFLERLKAEGVTHVAGTPSHWRRALMSPALSGLSPAYVRLSGEIADQAVLDALRARFPHACMSHAYASTEAGVGFEVADGLEGFPAEWVGGEDGPVHMRIVEDGLQLRSARTARGYLGEVAAALKDGDGWVDTGDLVERRGERFHFLGRRSGTINVGGFKIAPEEVEAVINACPGVRMSRVAGRASPLLGALVSAEVVLDGPADPGAARGAILQRCRDVLATHKVPASLRFVDALTLGAAGKLERRLA